MSYIYFCWLFLLFPFIVKGQSYSDGEGYPIYKVHILDTLKGKGYLISCLQGIDSVGIWTHTWDFVAISKEKNQLLQSLLKKYKQFYRSNDPLLMMKLSSEDSILYVSSSKENYLTFGFWLETMDSISNENLSSARITLTKYFDYKRYPYSYEYLFFEPRISDNPKPFEESYGLYFKIDKIKYTALVLSSDAPKPFELGQYWTITKNRAVMWHKSSLYPTAYQPLFYPLELFSKRLYYRKKDHSTKQYHIPWYRLSKKKQSKIFPEQN